MSASDWDRELAKIDKQLESTSDEQLFPTKGAKSPVEKAEIKKVQRTTSTFGVMFRLVLAVSLGVAMLFWPYGRCGLALAGYLAACGVVVGAGVWTSVWTWRHRSGQGHVLSLLLILWGLVLGATEILPKVGYAHPDALHAATWSCGP